jgi:PAS domain S-box-containing protein
LLVEKSPLAMGIATLSGKIEYLNAAMRRMFGDGAAGAGTVTDFINAAFPNDPAGRDAAMAYWRDEVLPRRHKGTPPPPFKARIEGRERWRDIVARCVVEEGRVLAVVEDVTELQQAQESLQRSEQRLSFALEGASDGLWDWDVRTNEVYYSPHWKALLGYKDDEVEHHFKEWEKLTHPEDLTSALQAIQDVLAGKTQHYEVEFRMRHKAGHWVDILSRGRLIRDANGAPVRMVGTHVDITVRKKARHVLLVQRDLALQLGRATDLKPALAVLLQSALQLPEFSGGAVHLRDVHSGCLDLVQAQGLSPETVQKLRHSPADSPQARIIARGQPVSASRSGWPPAMAETMVKENIEALAFVPIHDGVQVIGSLNAFTRSRKQIEPGVQMALEGLAEQASAAIARIRHADAQQEAERHLRLAVDGAGLGTWVADPDRDIFIASPFANELHGFAPDARTTLEMRLAVVHPEDRSRVTAAREQALATDGPYEIEYRVMLPDGRVRWNTTKARVYSDGGKRKVFGICYDITARKEAELLLRQSKDELEQRVQERTRELQESQARLETVIQTAPAGIVMHGADGRILHLNREARHMLGVSGANALGKTLQDQSWQFLREDGSLMPCAEFPASRVLATGRPVLGVIMGTKPSSPSSGSRWAYVNAMPRLDGDGRVMEVVASFMEITGRVEGEKKLADSEARLKLALVASGAGVWSWDLTTNTAWWDEQYSELYGFRPDEPRSYETWLERLFPEDRARLSLRVESLLRPGGSNSWTEEFRACHPRSGARWHVEFGMVHRDAAGNALRMTGIDLDITDRKLAEAALHQLNETLENRIAERTAALSESETRFRQLATATFEAIGITEKGIILDGNQQMADLFGYPLSEMIGRPVIDFIAPEERKAVADRIRAGGTGIYEHLCVRKDGSRILVEAQSRQTDADGQQLRITAMRDVTETRRGEAEAKEHREQLARFSRLAELSEVSVGIIHQLGQPFSAITSNFDVLSRQLQGGASSPKATQEIVDDISHDLGRIRDIIHRLRALAHPDQPHRQPTRVNTLVRDLAAMIRPEAEARQVSLQFKPANDDPVVSVDMVQINQALINLIRNAFDAVAEESTGDRAVAVTARTDEGRAVLEVSDSGKGIPPDVMLRLFEPFFTTKKGGMGVGLRLAQTIIQSHGGTIEVLNHGDQLGATFRIKLPLSKLAALDQPAE